MPSDVQIPRGSRAPRAQGRTTVVADVMHRGVLSCAPETPVRHVAEIMVTHRIHAVVVDDLRPGEARAWGVVSDLDLAVAFDGDHGALTAGEIAATDVVSVSPADSLADAARYMCLYEITHLVVVSPASRRPVGVVSTLDVARAIAWGSVSGGSVSADEGC